MASPLIRFIHLLPSWMLISSALILAALAGAAVATVVFLILGARWKRRKMNEDSRNRVDSLEIQTIQLQEENQRQAEIIRRYQAAIRGARASLNFSDFIGEINGKTDHVIDS